MRSKRIHLKSSNYNFTNRCWVSCPPLNPYRPFFPDSWCRMVLRERWGRLQRRVQCRVCSQVQLATTALEPKSPNVHLNHETSYFVNWGLQKHKSRLYPYFNLSFQMERLPCWGWCDLSELEWSNPVKFMFEVRVKIYCSILLILLVQMQMEFRGGSFE